MSKSELKSEDKLDLILKYMKSAKRWRMVSAFFSFIFFLIFIVLPLVSLLYLGSYLKSNVDIAGIMGQIEEVKSQAGVLDEISDLLNQIPR